MAAVLDEIIENGDASSDSEPVEWLAHGRSKRTTAGNRLSTLLNQEEAGDDDVTLLFKEDEEHPDEEFEDADASDEGGGGSSSSEDEEEQAGDELEGEEQLQKEERERTKVQKRKAEQKFMRPRPPTKRVRISEPGAQGGEQTSKPGRKRKKPERTSWILHDDNGQVRASSRTLSVQNKERTQASLKESEAKRSRQLAVMEATQKKREAEKRGPLTQEDRLREAAEVERQNSKSLNRWEEMEAERIKKQKQKLEALQNRKIEGPMIRWWSGPAEWVGDKLVRVGAQRKVEEDFSNGIKDVQDSKPEPIDEINGHDEVLPLRTSPPEDTSHGPLSTTTSVQVQPSPSSVAHTQQSPPRVSTSFLDGIEHYASMPDNAQKSKPQMPSLPVNTLGPLMTPYPIQQQPGVAQVTALDQFRAGAPISQETHPAPPPPPPVKGLRSLVTLENFDPIIKQSQEARSRIIFGLNSSGRAKPPPPTLCAITSQIAKYKDPLTGLPYRSLSEFKKIRNLPALDESRQNGTESDAKARWSEVLGAWIGTREHAAQGLPDSFLTGIPPSVDEPAKLDTPAGSNAVHVKPETDAASVS